MILVTLPRFDPGRVVATPGVVEALNRAGQSVWSILVRHLSLDCGECDEAGRTANDRAVEKGTHILSTYRLTTDETVWVVTDGDRVSTRLTLPDEW